MALRTMKLSKRVFGLQRLIFLFSVLIIGTFCMIIVIVASGVLEGKGSLFSFPNTLNFISGVNNSLCSEKATNLGFHQKVVSFSLFMNPKPGTEKYVVERYLRGAKENMLGMREFYPGWVMRIYTNLVNYGSDFGELNLLGSEPDVFICNIAEIHLPSGDLEKVHKMVWRFLPMVDPTVDIFIVRDLDSAISEREEAAVKEWEASDKIFHGMRDNPVHSIHIMGGMWGGKTKLINTTMRTHLFKIFEDRRVGDDQDILERAFVPQFLPLFMFHDSYNCQRFKPSHPFPKQRKNIKQHVGQVVYGEKLEFRSNVAVCPKECRPSYGKNWTYC